MKSRIILSGIIVAVISAGCSNLDFGNPTGPIADIGDKGKPFISHDTHAEQLAMAKQMAKVLAEWDMETEGSLDYHIGPEDVLKLGILSLEQPGKITELVRAVQVDGTVNLPWAGAVKVGGMTTKEAASTVLKEFKGRFIKDPAVTVAVSEYQSAPIVITGAVNQPGMYYLKRDRRSLLELLAEADGLSTAAGDELLLIRGGVQGFGAANGNKQGGNKLIPINLKKLISEGDLRLNLWVGKGDMLNIPPRNREYVYVLGYVLRPGGFELKNKDKVGAVQAVAMAGGLSASGRPANSFLLRKTEKGQSVTPIDLTKIMRATRPTVYLEPGDTLVVGSSLLARLSEFVKPSVSAGVSMSPGLP